MNLRLISKLLMVSSMLVIPIETIYAKNKHCALASSFIDGENFIGATGNSFLHLSTTIGAGDLLYALPRNEVTQDKPKGIFYYVESMTSSCIGWTMTLRADDGNGALFQGGTPRQIKCSSNENCGQLDAIIKWMPKNGNGYKHEVIHFKPTAFARLQEFNTGIPTISTEQIIAKTTYAVCSRVMADEHDFEHSDIFRQCLTSFSGHDAIEKPKK